LGAQALSKPVQQPTPHPIQPHLQPPDDGGAVVVGGRVVGGAVVGGVDVGLGMCPGPGSF